MADIRGLTGQRDAQGRPKAGATPVPVLVDKQGRLIVVSRSTAQSPSGPVLARAADDGTQYITSALTWVRSSIPGIGVASAYTSGDAFGTSFALHVPIEGTIATVVFRDYDDEGIAKEIVLFSDEFTATGDNDAFAVTDADLGKCVGVVNIATFYDFNSNQIGMATPAIYYIAPKGILYCQVVTRGADNIAQGAIPDLSLLVV